ncbi:DNA-formamidopyrimidine glycosylase family protein [Brachybacterium sp. AOP25-B2-12]|uniref:DNA-formamidopyrimidine glycosylase family protein n=1 Tax=Brachybacterium sp. AOP25-B2-12 TaxID=3457710 RepID=UPI0040345867
MPEGDSVFRATALLHAALAGGVLTRAELRVPQLAVRDLVGWEVHEVRPRGKHLLIRLVSPEGREPLTLHSHLMMEGRWHLDEAGPDGEFGPWRAPAHQARAVLEVEHPDGHRARAIAYEVQQVRLVRTVEEDAELIVHLGPDLLDPAWDAEHEAEAVRRLASAPERTIGAALLDQRNLAGIGNIYRSETCFLARIHPAVPIAQVPDLAALVRHAQRLLFVNRERSVRVTTGGLMGRDGDLWVYGRARRRCRRCSTPILREELDDPRAPAQQERSIYVCPRCQVRPGGSATQAPSRVRARGHRR